MAQLYELEIQSFPNGDGCERYGIGVFRTRQEAEDTARRYLQTVKGFKDYYCEYTVRETELIGDPATELVYTWFGWNLGEDDNEAEILSGLLYEYKDDARAALDAAKAAATRQEWSLLCWQVGKCEWAEGFDREYPSGRPAPTLAQLREELRSLIRPRTMCAIEYEYSDNRQYGFPLAVGEQLFLLAEEDDFYLNGFTVRRLRDIYELGDRKGIYQSIAEQESLTDFDAPDVGVSDWYSVFASLQGLGKHIIVEREYEPDFFRIGIIEAVEQDHAVLRHYDADGIWQEPERIDYREITSVTFDDRYSRVFSKYVS